ncbi:MAG: hypothetical protein CMJ76_06250 [Planctomycetaceae bacterium]|nr:hypothetical protein [Planctomycetaceae bacterium]
MLGQHSKLIFFLILALIMSLPIQANAGELNNLSGNWSGQWSSDISNHKGTLKAKFTVLNEKQVQARFNGRFFKLIPFKFIVTLDVVSQKEGVTKLKGKHDLGRALGIYHYDVTYKGNEFIAKYHTDKDKGVFQVVKSRVSSGNTSD